MKRDMELVRLILFEVEAQGYQPGWIDLEIEGYSAEAIVAHVIMLKNADLIEAIDVGGYMNVDWRPKRLTWAGHEFLDLARNDTVWRKTMLRVAAMGAAVSLPVLQNYLTEAIKGLPGGIPPQP